MKIYKILTLFTFIIFLFTACNKIENADFKQGNYEGTIKVKKDHVIIQEEKYILRLEKNIFEGEYVNSNTSKANGSYTVNERNITFSAEDIEKSGFLNGVFFNDYNKNNKRLILTKSVDGFQVMLDLNRVQK